MDAALREERHGADQGRVRHEEDASDHGLPRLYASFAEAYHEADYHLDLEDYDDDDLDDLDDIDDDDEDMEDDEGLDEDEEDAGGSSDEDMDDYDDDYDDDDDEDGTYADPRSSEGEYAHVPLILPRRSYKGARNMETVKDCNFLGTRADKVCSGSDDGSWFVWDRDTGRLEGLWEGDGDVVNGTSTLLI
jgi:nuclear receptor interaction protein